MFLDKQKVDLKLINAAGFLGYDLGIDFSYALEEIRKNELSKEMYSYSFLYLLNNYKDKIQ